MQSLSTNARRQTARVLRGVARRVEPSSPAPAPATVVEAPAAPESPADRWFDEHIGAARQVLTFLGGDGISLQGKRVADIGSGDGIIDLALALEGHPSEIIGLDLRRTDEAYLLERARARSYTGALPSNLVFRESFADRIPEPSGSFDVIVSWSCFEHITDLDGMAAEIRRIIKPDGVLFVQLWPFYHSMHGSHLEAWFPEGFVHLHRDQSELRDAVLSAGGDPSWSSYMWSEYESLNKATLDDIQAALQGAGFVIRKAELLSMVVHLPDGVSGYSLSDLLIAGVVLIATPM